MLSAVLLVKVKHREDEIIYVFTCIKTKQKMTPKCDK